MATFGKTLATLRQEKDVSQSELSSKTGIPIGTLRHHEYDLRAMSAEDLFRYAKALGVSATQFEGCKSAKSVRRRKRM